MLVPTLRVGMQGRRSASGGRVLRASLQVIVTTKPSPPNLPLAGEEQSYRQPSPPLQGKARDTVIKLREKYSFHWVPYGWRGMPGRALRALDAERPSGIPTQSVGTSPLNLMAVRAREGLSLQVIFRRARRVITIYFFLFSLHQAQKEFLWTCYIAKPTAPMRTGC